MNKAAQQIGSLGGKARAKALSQERRSEIAQKAGRLGGKASAEQRKRSAVVKKRLTAFYQETGGILGQ